MADKEKTFILNDNAPFAVQEAYRALRSNVIFSLPDSGGKCIGVTSGARGDRKSSTAINLAISFSEYGKKVIVIDCDLRLPTVAEKLKMHNTPGLSDVIVGNCKLGAAVQFYSERLDVIPAGTIPKDATGILSSERMKSLIARLKEIYDYVFVDLPPVNTVTDAVLLAGSIDGYLLVVHHEKTEYKEVNSMIKLLHMADAKILGFVYASAPLVKKKGYGYYYKK